MKRFLLMLMTMVLLCAAACAQELKWLTPTIGGNDAVMIVDNGEDWETKLNLRTEPHKGSEIKGRIFTGARVEVYEDDGEWCLVGVRFAHGSVLTGYVMKRYLSPLEDGFPALCPLAVANRPIKVSDDVGRGPVHLKQGDGAYVLAVCGDEYYVMAPDGGQGYGPADAFDPLEEPAQEERIQYGVFTVPSGGVSFEDEYTGETVSLAGGVLLEDCWKLPGEDEWHVTFGAGIQRTPRVQGWIPQEKLTKNSWISFEGDVYDDEDTFLARVGTLGGESILRRVDWKGDVFWAAGSVPSAAVEIDRDICRVECDPQRLLSDKQMKAVFDHVSKGGVLDERTSWESVSPELAARCTLRTALEFEPGSGRILRIHAWLEDTDGSYVTGGDLDVRTREITRWGCNA